MRIIHNILLIAICLWAAEGLVRQAAMGQWQAHIDKCPHP